MIWTEKRLFFFLEDDIKKKYRASRPRFIIDGNIVDKREDIVDWIDENYWNDEDEMFWAKYKYISDDLFELKMVIPDPPVEVRKKLVEDYIGFVKEKTPTPYFKIGKEIYGEEEVKGVLVEELIDGLSTLFYNPDFFPDPESNGKRIIYEVNFGEQELYWDIESGYRTFEDK